MNGDLALLERRIAVTAFLTKTQGGWPMQYTFQTDYNQKSLSVMAKCIRKTARAKHSKRSHVFG